MTWCRAASAADWEPRRERRAGCGAPWVPTLATLEAA
jgi:hypothetical protein